MLELFFLLCLIGALGHNASSDALAESINPVAYAARRQRERERSHVVLQSVCAGAILLLGWLFSF